MVVIRSALVSSIVSNKTSPRLREEELLNVHVVIRRETAIWLQADEGLKSPETGR